MIYVLTSQQIASHHRQASPPSSYLPTHPPTFNGLGFHLDTLCGELHSDGGLGVEVEFVPGEAGQQIGLPHAGVSDQDNCD